MFKRLTALAIVAAVGMASPAMAQLKKEKNKDAPKAQAPAAGQPDKDSKSKDKAPASLKVGDKAPPLSVENWVQGDKVEKFEEGKVYVVEFWATWCGPCKEAIPHLNQLNTEFKKQNVTVIGVAGSERGSDAKAKLDGVKKFVESKKAEMAYRVAYDDDRSMSNDWMKPAGQGGIPCAFVVGKDGKIAWIGHPAHGLEEAIKKAVNSDSKAEGPTLRPNFVLTSWQQEGQESPKAKPSKDQDKAKDTKKAADADDEAAPTLHMGDKAPQLSVEEWVKGEPVTGFDKGKTYIVEFWATWCGPCIAAMPHLTETAKEYKDKGVTVIGVASSERGTKKLEKVKKFVDDKGEGMGYKVAYDDDRSMAKTWLDAAGQSGIPCTFIVNGDGKVAWIGHPMEMDEPLKKIVDGTWDLAAESAKAKKAADAAARSQKLQEQVQEAMQNGDQDKALKLMDDLMDANPAMAGGIAAAKFKMLGEKDNEKAYAWARKAIEGPVKDSAQGLNAIAWTIVDPADSTFTKKDLDLALRAAMRADEVSKHKDAAIVDTLAKVYHDKGDLAKAVELQEKAIKLLDDMPEAQRDQMEEELKDRLKSYKEEAKKKGA
jgi:thiol-disulfide isomerase/thioredoxin